jgi:hypothetical protein
MAKLQFILGGPICGIPSANLRFTLRMTRTKRMTGTVQRPVTGAATSIHMGGPSMICCVLVATVSGSAPSPRVEAATVTMEQEMLSRMAMGGSFLARQCTTTFAKCSFTTTRARSDATLHPWQHVTKRRTGAHAWFNAQQ